MQGRAAIHHLARSTSVTEVTAADRDPDAIGAVRELVADPDKVRTERLDVSDADALRRLLTGGFDVVVDLLPVALSGLASAAAVETGVHWVNASYPTDDLRRLGPAAEEAGVILLPELGMDPGVDLVLLGDTARRFSRISAVLSYGGGIPEPEAADNALRYKISWTFEGVLRSYRRAGVLVRDGDVVHVSDREQFAPDHLHEVHVEGVGPLEAAPNGDVRPYLAALGLEPEAMAAAGRFTLRYPGHAAFWRPLVDLHLLDEEPVRVDGALVDRRRFLARALEPHLQYGPDERDLAILRVEVAGTRDGREERVVTEVVDRRDLETGLTAMGRLVGFSASIGAQMIGRGEIREPGLRSPLTDVPADAFLEALEAEGVHVLRSVVPDTDTG